MADLDFLGRGMSFPLKVNPATGDFQGISGKDSVRASVRMFLSTVRGERIFNEGYGMPSLVFESYSQGSADVIKQAAIQGLAIYEPRIRVTNVEVTPGFDAKYGKNGVRVAVKWVIRSTNEEDNLVFIPAQLTEQF